MSNEEIAQEWPKPVIRRFEKGNEYSSLKNNK